MDLSNLNLAVQAEAGYSFNVKHPVTEEELDGVITVRGDESKVVRAFERRKASEYMKKYNKDKNFIPTPAENDDWNVESAICRVISWKNIELEGQEISFTKENADRVFREYPWLAKQVTEASANLLNFQPSGT